MNSATQDPARLVRLARAGSMPALGELLELYRGYLELLARLQIGRRLQGKVDAADLVQETFLAAHAGFAEFRGTTEAELVGWLRQILASRLAKLERYYYGTQGRDIRLERELADAVDQSSRILDQNLIAPQSSYGMSLPSAHGSLHFFLRIGLLHCLAFVVQLAAAGQGDFNAGEAAAEVEFEGDERAASLVGFAGEFLDLAPVQ